MFSAYHNYQIVVLLVISISSAAVEVPLYDSAQLESLDWPTYSSTRLPANRAWREASYTTSTGRLTRVYTVCNVAVPNTDNWLYMPYISRSSANRIYIRLRFSIRGCTNYPDPVSLQQCKESFRLLYYDADGPVDVTQVNENQFTSVDVIAATNVFTDTSNVTFNTEIRSFTVTRSGFVFAFRDLGSCTTLISVRIYYIACESFASSLVSYPRTASGPEVSSIVSVPGVCVSYSQPYPNNMPTSLCTADGRWFTVTGGCTCQVGYQLNSTQCSACPQLTYKPYADDAACMVCPANSVTSSVGSSYCPCIDGFQRSTSDTSSPCYRKVGSVTNLSVTNTYGPGVILSWNPPTSGGTGILYNVHCLECDSDVLFLPRQYSLNQTSVTVRGLDASSIYTMTVYSQSVVERITDSGVNVVIQTPPASSSGPNKPIQCHVATVGIQFISLACQSPDGRIDLFEVTYWADQINNNISLAYCHQSNVTVYGLQPRTTYLFIVRGKTATGWTDYSDVVSVATQNNFAETQQLTSLSEEKGLVGIIVGSTIGIIVCLAILVLAAMLYIRRNRRHRSNSSSSSSDMLKYISGQHASHPVGATAHQGNSTASASIMSAMSDSGHVYADLCAYEDPGLLGRQTRKEIDPACVTIERLAGSGQFGDIFFGRLTLPDQNPVFVTIDILPDMASEESRLWFLATADLMRQLDDPNVIYTEGIVTKNTPHMILTEYTPHGSLLEFLRNGQNRLATSILLTMAHGVASGMKYLADKGYVHTDLAAENVLVGERYVCKIASLDFCRKVGDREFSPHQNFAVRWCAPEVLLGQEFTQAADVWSYGVLMWEILTYGKQPYSALSNHEITRAVCGGAVLPVPPATCSEDMYRLMLTCWKMDLRQRPTFTEIAKTLLQLLRLQTVTFSNSFLNDSAFV